MQWFQNGYTPARFGGIPINAQHPTPTFTNVLQQGSSNTGMCPGPREACHCL